MSVCLSYPLRYNHEDSDVTRKCVQLEALYKKTMASMTEAARMLRLATDTKVKEAEEGNGQVKAHDSSDSDSDSSSDESSSSSSDVESDGGADGHDSDFEQRQSQVVKLQKEVRPLLEQQVWRGMRGGGLTLILLQYFNLRCPCQAGRM